MIDDLIIRSAKKEDFEQVFSLVIQLEELYGDPIEYFMKNKPAYQVQFEKNLKIKNFFMKVAELNGHIIAYIAYSPIIGNWNINDKHWEIAELCVDKDFRNQKIGEKMLDYVENIMRKKDVSVVHLGSEIVRKDAHRFYENHGFEKKYFKFRKNIK